ncbi:helix-turn-helix domain-containing protein [Sediminitomix flava]|uniref:Helix-turn-helix protein n=1 Tax=Sediminitomix flava TaxID=379075 RepID=A0A315ZGE7_SEDFL|nr:helix-turn-helix domain-containing protein [Sediminitomix flava]PWJ44665.1 helix-turn-helix protein [Sediminitomix flava]
MRNLEYSDRVRIEKCLNLGLSVKRIAKIIGFAPSSIYREIKRNTFKNTSYKAKRAHRLYIARKKRVGSMRKHLITKTKRKYPFVLIRDRREILWFSDTRLGRNKQRRKSRLKGIRFRSYRPRLGYKKYLYMSDYALYLFLEKHEGVKLKKLKVDVGFYYYFKRNPILPPHKTILFRNPKKIRTWVA